MIGRHIRGDVVLCRLKHVAWQPILGPNRQNRLTSPSFVTLAFWIGWKYCNTDGHNSGDHLSMLCRMHTTGIRV